MIDSILSNKYLIGILAAIGSSLLTILTQQVLNRRGRFRYFVTHGRVGVSSDDVIFGSVKITWNDTPVANLYLSTVEMVNESMRDYENVEVRAYTGDTNLLTERTEIVGTTQFLKFTDEYLKQIHVEPGQQPTKAQIEMYFHQRHYLIPTFNRGQIIRFNFLNTAITQNQPNIWLDILHKGVKLKFGVAHKKILEVPQPTAGWVGLIIGLFVVGAVVYLSHTVWLAAILSFVYGIFAQIPGALAVKAWRWLKNMLGG